MDMLITTREAAALLNVSSTTLLTMVERGAVKAIKLGPKTIRFPRQEIDALLARSATAPRRRPEAA